MVFLRLPASGCGTEDIFRLYTWVTTWEREKRGRKEAEPRSSGGADPLKASALQPWGPWTTLS